MKIRKIATLIMLMTTTFTLFACGKGKADESATEATTEASVDFVEAEDPNLTPKVDVDEAESYTEEAVTEEPISEEAPQVPQTGISTTMHDTGVASSNKGSGVITLEGKKEEATEEATETKISENVVIKRVISEDSISKNDTVIKEEEELTGERIIKTVFIDPGHGGDAAGATEFAGVPYVRAASGAPIAIFPANSLGTTTGTSSGNITECDVVYDLATKIKSRLESNGFEVVLSRDDVHVATQGGGTAIGNWERGRLASQYDCWIVLHIDSGGGHGIHCVSYNNDPTFRNDLCDAFISDIESKNRTIYTAKGFNHGYSGNSSGLLQGPQKYIEYGGNVNNIIYLEAGFMDNSDDKNFVLSEDGQDAIADSLLYALNTRRKKTDTSTTVKKVIVNKSASNE